MLVYLFRIRDRATTFAYSTAVRGRNLALQMPLGIRDMTAGLD